MAYSSLSSFIDSLEQQDELIRIPDAVSTQFQMTEIVDRLSKKPQGGKAVLFENTGTNFPIVMNLFGSDHRIAQALNVSDLDQVGDEIMSLFKSALGASSFTDKLLLLSKALPITQLTPKTIRSKGKCQEIIDNDPSLDILPILECWPSDGGPFITLPAVHTVDPETGIGNVGMYRMQKLDSHTTGMHWHKHKTGANHFEKYKALGQKMPVTVTLGGDPAYIYAATAPMPENMHEYLLAGFLRKKRVQLVKSITNDINVPSDVDIVIEGYVDPQEDLVWEGPFGDHTGFYSLADWYPKFHVTCITHRKDAVYPATIVGVPPQEDAWIGKATERIFLTPMQIAMVPEASDIFLPPAGVAHNLVCLSIDKSYAGQAHKVMSSMWGGFQMMFNKVIGVFDSEINIHDYTTLLSEITKKYSPSEDTIYTQGPLDVLDHASDILGYGSKLGLDVTTKFAEEKSEIIDRYWVGKCDINLEKYPEIIDIYDKLLLQDLSLVIVSIEKSQSSSIKSFSEDLFSNGLTSKIAIYVDHDVTLKDLYRVAWITSGNVDPKRDCWVHENDQFSQLAIDGTRKVHSKDNFKREWPNVVVSDEETITWCDNHWEKLGLGEFVQSPSREIKLMSKGNSAYYGKDSE